MITFAICGVASIALAVWLLSDGAECERSEYLDFMRRELGRYDRR